jgi:hypothetical protein
MNFRSVRNSEAAEEAVGRDVLSTKEGSRTNDYTRALDFGTGVYVVRTAGVSNHALPSFPCPSGVKCRRTQLDSSDLPAIFSLDPDEIRYGSRLDLEVLHLCQGLLHVLFVERSGDLSSVTPGSGTSRSVEHVERDG